MSSKRSRAALVAAAPAVGLAVSLLVSCGADGGDGSGSGGSHGPAWRIVVEGCDEACDPDAHAAWLTCSQEKCATDYERCFGAGYAAEDYSGAVCESGLGCLTNARTCGGNCDPGEECFACVTELTNCILGSGCPSPGDCSEG